MTQKKGSRVSEPAEEVQVHVPLQAILLADSFTQKFRPITLERPKVLLPLVNIPMIEYSLAWLESVGVEEVFVFCCAHSKQVTDYLEKSQWMSHPTFSVTAIESHDSISAGDALRLIDQRNVIRGDFVLMSGDTVSNMSLMQALKEHKERRKKDMHAIMTMVIKQSKPSSVTHQTRLGNDELLLAIDSETNQLLYYEDKADQSRGIISLDKMLLADRPGFFLHIDKQDCFIDICSPEVLTVFSDNFDFQHRRDFVKDVLVNEITGYKLFTHEIHSGYAARIDNLRSYDTISKDIIQRWTYPFVPDVQFSGNCPHTKQDRQAIYRASDILQSRSAVVGPFSLVGEGTVIGDNSSILSSIVGQGCSIGSNVLIEGCYVWNNVSIHDNCKLKHAIICDGAVVKAGAVLEPGVILSFKVVIGPDFVVPAYSKVSLLQQPTKQDSDEELEYADSNIGIVENPCPLSMKIAGATTNFLDGGHMRNNQQQIPWEFLKAVTGILNSGNEESLSKLADGQCWDASKVGISGAGYLWSLVEGCLEDELRYSIAPIPFDKLKEFTLDGHDDEESPNQDVNNSAQRESETESDDDEDDDYESASFDKEVEETFRRVVLEVPGVEQKHVIIEVNSLRLAENKTFSDCAAAIFRSVMNLALEDAHDSSRELFVNAKRVLSKWTDLLKYYIRSQDEEIEVLLKFEEVCESEEEFSPIFSLVLGVLYENEIITEPAILAWAAEKENAESSDKIFVNQSRSFIQWLKEAEEEDD